MFKRFYDNYKKDSFYLNSIFMMSSTFISSVFGFAFWLIMTHIFSVEKVGIATALISLTALISNFTHLGLNVGLIRYLPNAKNKNEIISSSIILVGIVTIIVSLIALYGLKQFSPQLVFLQYNPIYEITFIFFMLGSSFNILIESIFMGYRVAKNILLKNVILSILKLILPFFMISIGAYGIFSSVSIAIIISVVLSMFILIYKYNYHPSFVFSIDALKKMALFSGGNYIAGFLSQIPLLLLPLFVINILHAKAAAYFYIDSMIFNLLITIPLATTNSLLAEGSHNSSLINKQLLKSIKIIIILLIPSVLVIFFFGNNILLFFGKSYESEAFNFLKILSLSTIFISVTYIGNSLLRIRHKIFTLISMNFIGNALIFSLSYFFITYGLTGVGWGWLLGQSIMAFMYIVLFNREFSFKNLLLQKIFYSPNYMFLNKMVKHYSFLENKFDRHVV